jgi:hypothetical protein
MEFLIYDYECPAVDNAYNFWEALPWICTVLSIYMTINFLLKLMDSSFENQISELTLKIVSLDNENDDLIAKRNELERELEHVNAVLKALVSKFVAEEHPLTKVD